MIKIEKGQVEFDGEGRELLAEFAAIVCNLLKYFSEAELMYFFNHGVIYHREIEGD